MPRNIPDLLLREQHHDEFCSYEGDPNESPKALKREEWLRTALTELLSPAARMISLLWGEKSLLSRLSSDFISFPSSSTLHLHDPSMVTWIFQATKAPKSLRSLFLVACEYFCNLGNWSLLYCCAQCFKSLRKKAPAANVKCHNWCAEYVMIWAPRYTVG